MKRFWERLEAHGDRTALYDWHRGTRLSFRQLSLAVEAGAEALRAYPRTVVFAAIGHDIDGVVCYLSALAAGHVVWLSDCTEGEVTNSLLRQYASGILLWQGTKCPAKLQEFPGTSRTALFSYDMLTRPDGVRDVHPQLALLLSTSGSVNAPKLVRLSYENLTVAATQAATAVEIGPEDTALACLPFHHVYGLSVLHSALLVGATLIVGPASVLDRQFWQAADEQGATFLPAVPSQLRMIRGSRIEMALHNGLRRICVSGSALDAATHAWLAQMHTRTGMRIYSMYGMTEATGRIAVLPADDFDKYRMSVGRAVPGGRLELLPSGEIVYSGPNVMLGLATTAADLQLGDSLTGRLQTGDLGALDTDGNLYIKGRMTRICKVLDTRVELDDLEARLASHGDVAVVGDDSSIDVICAAGADIVSVQRDVEAIADRLHLPRHVFRVARVAGIPRTSSGKRSYGMLRTELEGRR